VEVVEATGSPCGFTGPTKRGQEKTYKKSDNRDDDEEFNKRKPKLRNSIYSVSVNVK